jgi:hypothetical protein
MSESPADLRFDKATYAEPAASTAAPCGGCKSPLVDQYWKWQRLLVCARCREGLEVKLKETTSAGAFGKAFLQGGGVALACGVAYAVFVAVSDTQFALATIGIAIAVATVVRKASGGVSGRRFQILAVALTYAASTMGYAPAIFHALQSSANHHDVSHATGAARPVSPQDPATSPSAPLPADPGDAPKRTEADGAKKGAGPLDVVVALVLLVGITLASPFLEITEAPLGAFIIAIGLWSAWRRTQPVPLVIEGPFRVAPAAPAPPAAA